MNNPNCLVFSIDFDGCSDNQGSQERIINNALAFYRNNQNIEKIIFMIGSLRQSLELDIHNALQNSTPPYLSCTILNDTLPAQMKQKLDEMFPYNNVEVVFDTFLQSDLFGDLEFGTNFQAMQEVFKSGTNIEQLESVSRLNKHGEEVNLLNLPHLTDCSKLSIIYTQLHYLANIIPGNYMLHFFDDREDILDQIQAFYSSNLRLVPATAALQLILHRSHDFETQSKDVITGTGGINPNYVDNLRELASSLSWAVVNINDFSCLRLQSMLSSFTQTEDLLAFEGVERNMRNFNKFIEQAFQTTNSNIDAVKQSFITVCGTYDDCTDEIFEAQYKKLHFENLCYSSEPSISRKAAILSTEADNALLLHENIDLNETAKSFAAQKLLHAKQIKEHLENFKKQITSINNYFENIPEIFKINFDNEVDKLFYCYEEMISSHETLYQQFMNATPVYAKEPVIPSPQRGRRIMMFDQVYSDSKNELFANLSSAFSKK